MIDIQTMHRDSVGETSHMRLSGRKNDPERPWLNSIVAREKLKIDMQPNRQIVRILLFVLRNTLIETIKNLQLQKRTN